ncbi:MAG: endonuclease/exonuclease/phosphatase family protein [Planctomycetaceae bacterium]
MWNRNLNLLVAVLILTSSASSLVAQTPSTTVRVATMNVSLNRPSAGQLVKDLAAHDAQAMRIASILRQLRPDIVLLNEFDFDAQHTALQLFQERFLRAVSPTFASEPLIYEHAFTAPVNTGVPSGMDLNGDGNQNDPADAFGYGLFPGQYGMVVLSRFPIDYESVRTFQNLLWHTMPNAARPVDPKSGQPWYDDTTWIQLRLSSKSHWDVPVTIGPHTLHLLASHPTPPAFDGPEDRNGKRNHDEIRLWADYVSPERSDWIVDDAGQTGGLGDDAAFVILGDLNADPADGDSHDHAIRQLLTHRRINAAVVPGSFGATEAAAAQKGANDSHVGRPVCDTADFPDGSVGNLRVDYVLPSLNLTITGAGVAWPRVGEPGSEHFQSSDHHPVWIDIAL